MPIYMFVARDSSGNAIQGHQEAPTEAAVVSILQNKGLYVTHVINTVAVVKSARAVNKKRHKKAKSEDLLFFIAQIANLLAVGIPFVRCLEVVTDVTESQQMYDVIKEIIKNIRAGATFKDAISRHPKIFPGYWAFLIEAGELSGTLPTVLTQLAKNLEATENLKKKVVSAMVYPTVLVTAAVGAVLFFIIFIIPIFAKLFISLHAELPLITRIILATSQFLQKYILFILAAVVGLGYYLKNVLATPAGQRVVESFSLNVPIFGLATSDIIHARICIILSMLIKSGLSFLKSIEITGNVSGNYIFRTALTDIRLGVQQGKTLSTSLAEHAIFSPMFVNLVKIGEESGKLPEMIEKSSEYFAAKVDTFAARVGVLIEPIIMIFVGGMIGVIGVSIFLPIIKISTAAG